LLLTDFVRYARDMGIIEWVAARDKGMLEEAANWYLNDAKGVTGYMMHDMNSFSTPFGIFGHKEFFDEVNRLREIRKRDRIKRNPFASRLLRWLWS